VLEVQLYDIMKVYKTKQKGDLFSSGILRSVECGTSVLRFRENLSIPSQGSRSRRKTYFLDLTLEGEIDRSNSSESDYCVCEISGMKHWKVGDVTCMRMLLCNRELLLIKSARQGLSARMLW